ncbi:dopamine receptor 1-like [Leptopilina heterotoma]|uniref:dopamine receptor 1-like n=1 Tax=Leptopilina heterotoma TaxID=63436 RepID=UPI001CA8E255|nr:dopamine receptor 1-like [Leptopilina heterotoma]
MPNIGSIMSIGTGSRKSASNIDEGNMNTWNVALVTGRSSSSALSFKFTSPTTTTKTTTTIADQQLSSPLPLLNFPSSSLSSSKLSELSGLSSLSSSKLAELSGLQVELSSSGLSSSELSELSGLSSSELSSELSSSALSTLSSTTSATSSTTPTIEYEEEITVNNTVITDNNKNSINTKNTNNNNKRKLICDCESGCERTINTETEKSVYNMTTIEDNLLFDFNDPLEDFDFTFNSSSSSLNETLYPCNKSMENETFIVLSMYPSGYSLPTIVFASIVVTLLMIVIVVGNMLVIIAIATEKALKNIQNWFIASLAVADFFLGLIIMPFSLANEIMGYWIFGYWWCDIYSAMDVLLCTASIMNLCLISLDRFWSITQAIAYLKKRTPARAALMIALVWLLSALVCIPPLLGWKRPNPEEEYPKCKVRIIFLKMVRAPGGALVDCPLAMWNPYTEKLLVEQFRY